MVEWIYETGSLGQPEQRTKQEKRSALEGVIAGAAIIAFTVGLFWLTASGVGGKKT